MPTHNLIQLNGTGVDLVSLTKREYISFDPPLTNTKSPVNVRNTPHHNWGQIKLYVYFYAHISRSSWALQPKQYTDARPNPTGPEGSA